MRGFIDNFDFKEMEAMKYYAPPNNWTAEKKKDTATSRIFSGEWMAAEKYDGYFIKIVKDEDGEIMALTRSRGVDGEYPNKISHIPHLMPFFDELPNGTCFLGELYLPSKPGSKNITTILGCLPDKAIARQEKGEKLHLYIFDVLAFQGKSYMKIEAEDRFDELNAFSRAYPNEYVDWALYYEGKELWTKLQEVLAEGGEGMVIINKNSLYQPGKRSTKVSLKIKKELQETIDCFFTGKAAPPTKVYTGKEIETWEFWQDMRTEEKLVGKYFDKYENGEAYIPLTKTYFNGWAGSLEIGVMRNGEIVPIGWLSGLTDEIKANFRDYAGRCIEVSAMELDDETNSLRHGRFIQFRDDLNRNDCTYEKAFGHE